MSPVFLPVVLVVHVTHAKRRAVGPDPGFLDLLARPSPAATGEPGGKKLLGARDQVLELLIALAKENPVPVRRIPARQILTVVAEEKVRLAAEYRPAVEQFVNGVELNGACLGARLRQPGNRTRG